MAPSIRSANTAPVTAPSPLDRDLASGALATVLAEIAEQAAAVILPFWRAGAEVHEKSDASPVTEADRKAEALILKCLAHLYPGVQTVAEEASEADGVPAACDGRFFLVDPLDGTKGFVRGGESFTVNIALIEGGVPVAGVVVAPAMGVSWRGGPDGAFRRASGEAWRPIKVRARPDVSSAVVSHSMSDEEAERLARRHGCGAWHGADSSVKFCLVAEGRCDVYPRTGPTMEWDTAAGQAVLEAAGGRMVTPDGARFTYGKPGFRNGAFVAMGG